MQIVEVLIEYANHSLNRPFSYLYKGNKRVGVGYRVIVNFNNREIVGYVVNVSKTDKTKEQLEDELGFAMGEVIDVMDDSPLLNEDLLALADQIADYYLAPKISVLQSMLPPSLSPRHSSLKAPKIAYDQYLVVKDDRENDLTSKQIELLRLIKHEQKVLKKEVGSPSVVEKLIEYGRIGKSGREAAGSKGSVNKFLPESDRKGMITSQYSQIYTIHFSLHLIHQCSLITIFSSIFQIRGGVI